MAADTDEGWSRFDAAFRRQLAAVAYARCRNRERAEDLVQETILRFYRVFADTPEQLEDDQPIFPWLACACRFAWLDQLRKRPLEAEMEPDEERPHDRFEIRRLVVIDHAHCRREMTPQHRFLLDNHGRGFTVRELADQTGIPRGTVNRMILAAKARVAECLARHGWTEDEVLGVLS
jgi:RNA polymerase sigma factor (sigma-70 family)